MLNRKLAAIAALAAVAGFGGAAPFAPPVLQAGHGLRGAPGAGKLRRSRYRLAHAAGVSGSKLWKLAKKRRVGIATIR